MKSSYEIEFRGFVPDEQIEDVWASATLFAMPGVMEGFGLVYIEAMRHGLPVIASVHDAAPEINLDGILIMSWICRFTFARPKSRMGASTSKLSRPLGQ